MTLGTLAAGLAHEINNPAAAASRAADALETACQTLLSSLRRLADDEISAKQFAVLDTLRREIEPQAAVLDSLAMADQEDALSSWLTGRGIVGEWMIAPPLAAAGVDLGWCEQVATALPGSALQPGLEWVASTLSAATLLSEITGLGLDIAQRIVVERHGGTITIDSRPGETVLRVRIPARSRTAQGRAAS